MKVIIFGYSGMVGQGVLRECLLCPEVSTILLIGRRKTGLRHNKVKVIEHSNFKDLSAIATELAGYEACFFCLGVSSAGMKEEEYHRITYDFTMTAANTLVRLNTGMTFIYVSGTGTDSSERGHIMWARVKGKTENALLSLPFKGAYMFRPGFIQPMNGIISKTKLYRLLYAVTKPIYPILSALAPDYVTTTEKVGRAMIRVVQRGYPKQHLENKDINILADKGDL